MLRPAFALLCLVPPITSALGQSPAERSAIDRFRDSLATRTDVVGLRADQRALSRESRENEASQLERGLVALRLAELGADSGAGDAVKAFQHASRRRPDWPYAWHLLALAEERRAAWERTNRLALGSRVGIGTLERAAGHERRALEADPGFAPAAERLAGLTLDLRDTSRVAQARDAVSRAVHAKPALAGGLLLVWGRLERAAGALDSAIGAFERVPAQDGLSPVARLEAARSRLAAGDPAAPALYYAAAASDDSAAVAGYRADLALIASDAELAGFDSAAGDSRVAFLRRFWSDRDQAELRADGERLREHYRRLLYAQRHFALTVSRRYYGDHDAYRSGSAELDDRGVVYLRHGEPAERLRPFVFGLMPNETWHYARADGDLLLHFSAGYDPGTGGGDLYDYRLVTSVLDLHGAEDAPRDQLLLSRRSLAPVYAKMLVWGPYGAARAAGEERAIGEASVVYATTTDSYELQYARRLVAFADLIAVGSRNGAGLGHFVFAIGPSGTQPEGPMGAVYPVRVRLAALDDAGHGVAAGDTTLIFHLRRPLGPGEYLVGRVELPLPEGRWWWRAAIEEGRDGGVVLPRDSVRADAPSPALALSDLALGIRAASAAWVPAPGDTVFLTPFELFPAGSELQLYYEASGTVPGTTYRHQIGVFRIKHGDRIERRASVTLGVDERAEGSLVRAHRTLSLQRLAPGRYLVEVRVGGIGGEVVRRRLIRVVKPR